MSVLDVDVETMRRETSRITEAVGPARRWDGAAIRFVEDKAVDPAFVDRLLQHSQAANHWTNFGPLSLRLERDLADRLRLPPSLRVVMCSSGTQAMHALVGMHETVAQRRLRWVTSAFGYYCTIQGPLAEAAVVDCDARSLLRLDELDVDAFDGFIVTNAFGLFNDLEAYRAFASAHDKVLIVDAAMAYRCHAHGPNEIISFHHTKPWGFGEGGSAIVAAEHEDLFRSLISLGHRPGQAINRRATNGKASDIASAYHLMRLSHLDHLEQTYRQQYERIAALGVEVGFEPLGQVMKHPGIPGNVPLLARMPIADVRHRDLPTGRYYHPLGELPRARDIFDRIVNVPCHPGIASIDDAVLAAALRDIAAR